MDQIKLYRWAVFLFTAAYMVYFFIRAYITQNYEFFYYAIVIGILLFLLVRIARKVYLKTFLIAGISFVVLLNFLGGTIMIKGENLEHITTRLYDTYLISNIIKYDNLVHFLASLLMSFLVIELMFELTKDKFPKSYVDQMIFFFMIFFAAFGLTATVEIIEFIAVGMFDAAEGVGDYYNNAIDLVFNFWGVFVAILFFIGYHKGKEKIKFFGEGRGREVKTKLEPSIQMREKLDR